MSNGWAAGCKIFAWIALIGGIVAGIIWAIIAEVWWPVFVGIGSSAVSFLIFGTLGYIADNVGASNNSFTPEWISRSIQNKVDESVKASEKGATPVAVKELSDGSWVCSCGRTNGSYVSTCVCGINKRDALEKAREEAKEKLLTQDGALICPQCKTRQDATRHSCWKCGYKFD